MFPIAFSVIEMENTKIWTWFMEIFFADVGIENGNAITALMLNIKHRHCIRHLHNNLKIAGHIGLALKQRLWVATRVTTIPTWEAETNKMLGQTKSIFDWLRISQ